MLNHIGYPWESHRICKKETVRKQNKLYASRVGVTHRGTHNLITQHWNQSRDQPGCGSMHTGQSEHTRCPRILQLG